MKRLSCNFIKEQYTKVKYKFLSKKYINCRTKNTVECPEGHQYDATYSSFQQGYRCPICCIKIRRKKQKHSYEYIKEQFAEEGYKLLSKEYKNVHTKLLIQCHEGHQYDVTYGNFQQGQRCPVCWKLDSYSRSEKECLNVVKQLTNEIIIENDRTQIINPKTNYFLELDMWIPSLKKAIEFNGEYYHKHRKYEDNQKVKQCKEKDIDLLIIKYQDWINNREEQIEKIRGFFM